MSTQTLTDEQRELGTRAFDEFLAKSGGEMVSVNFDVRALLAIIAQLQTALRHPQNTGPTSKIARQFISGISARYADPGSALEAVIELGNRENDADAADRLIAAAPALLAACEITVDYLHRVSSNAERYHDECMKPLLAAIAKATGVPGEAS